MNIEYYLLCQYYINMDKIMKILCIPKQVVSSVNINVENYNLSYDEHYLWGYLQINTYYVLLLLFYNYSERFPVMKKLSGKFILQVGRYNNITVL